MDLALLALVWGFSFLIWWAVRKRRKRKGARAREPSGYLDRTLLRLGGTTWSVRDCCTGILILGQTGSGKTSGPLAAIIAALMRTGGMLLVCNKPDDRERFLKAARQAGRLGDVVVVDGSPGGDSCNFLDAILQGVTADDATKALLAAGAFSNFLETLDRGKRGGGEDNQFWRQQADRLTRNCFHLALFAGQRCTAGGLLRLVQSLPNSPAELSNDIWKASPLNQTLRAAYANRKGRESEYDELSAFFLSEMATLSGKTKSIVQATVAGCADAVSRGLVGRLLSGETTFSADRAVEHGALVIVDVPQEFGDLARLVNVGYKAIFQAAILRRKLRDDTRTFALVIDELQLCVTRGDWLFTSRSRQFRGFLVGATQSIEGLRAELGGEGAKDEVEALIANLGTKIVSLPSHQTAEWAAGVIGKTRIRMHGASASAGAYRTPADLVVPQQGQQAGASASFSEVFEYLVRPEEFQNLRTGGPAHGYVVDVVVLMAGKRFPDTGGLPWCFASFSQR